MCKNWESLGNALNVGWESSECNTWINELKGSEKCFNQILVTFSISYLTTKIYKLD